MRYIFQNTLNIRNMTSRYNGDFFRNQDLKSKYLKVALFNGPSA